MKYRVMKYDKVISTSKLLACQVKKLKEMLVQYDFQTNVSQCQTTPTCKCSKETICFKWTDVQSSCVQDTFSCALAVVDCG